TLLGLFGGLRIIADFGLNLLGLRLLFPRCCIGLCRLGGILEGFPVFEVALRGCLQRIVLLLFGLPAGFQLIQLIGRLLEELIRLGLGDPAGLKRALIDRPLNLRVVGLIGLERQRINHGAVQFEVVVALLFPVGEVILGLGINFGEE